MITHMYIPSALGAMLDTRSWRGLVLWKKGSAICGHVSTERQDFGTKLFHPRDVIPASLIISTGPTTELSFTAASR
jgi:hypothetical protein